MESQLSRRHDCVLGLTQQHKTRRKMGGGAVSNVFILDLEGKESSSAPEIPSGI